ncbi:MAG: hypothetical protein ABSB15_22030 [Bryobacteraceae bacterium]|jgi:hypothetical protein
MLEPTPLDAPDNHTGLAKTLVLESESAERFVSITNAIEADLQPRTSLEEIIVGDIIANHWRRLRTRCMEKALMDHEISHYQSPLGVTLPVTKAVLACRWAAGQSGIFDLLGRLENRCSRNMAASLRLLLQLRAARELTKEKIERKDL